MQRYPNWWREEKHRRWIAAEREKMYKHRINIAILWAFTLTLIFELAF